jgi:3-hydroxybutyryl-CoA dehydrogenase
VVRDIEMVYYRESGDETDAPPKLLLDKIERGELGIKTGKGFSYPNPAFQAPGWLKGDSERVISDLDQKQTKLRDVG